MSNYDENEQEEQYEGEQDNIRHIQVEVPQKQKIYKRFRVRVYLDMCKYNVVHDLCEERRWKECEDTDDWNLFWYDWSVSNEVVVKMMPYQKINHFPGMEQITRKDTLARNMNRCRKSFPELYDFFPQTYYIPNDAAEFKSDYEKNKGRIYISKPVASCQGRGIHLFNNISNIDLSEPQVIQHYIPDPYLVNGYKFDLRLYVVVLQVLPYPVILYYHDGMARFCTAPFQEPNAKNIKNTYMHLTNYALNKNNPDFEFNQDCEHDDQGSKQGLQTILDRLGKEGCDVQQLNNDIYDLILKTIFGILPNLQHSYLSSRPGVPKFTNVEDPFECKDVFFGSNCFEILGFDVMIDRKFKPWLIEVNHSPSFTCDTPLDLRIKENLIGFVLDILDIQQDDKIIHERQMKLESVRRLYGKQTKSVLASRKKNQQQQPKKGGIQTQKKKPTYKSIQEFYATKVAESNGLFTMIYPLGPDDEDIYREIVLNLKNPFISEQSVRNMNQVVPVRVEVAINGKTGSQLLRSKNTLQKQIKQIEQQNKQRQPSVPRQSSQSRIQTVSAAEAKRQMAGIQKKAAEEFEFGAGGRSLSFRGGSGQVLLRQGVPRNAKLDNEVETDLFNRKMALNKMRYISQISRLIEGDDDEQLSTQRRRQDGVEHVQPPPPPPKTDAFAVLSGVRSRSANRMASRLYGARKAAKDDSRVQPWR